MKTIPLARHAFAATRGRVQVLDRFVDLARGLVADGHAIDARMAEREPHRLPPVLAIERAFARQLHGDDAHSLLADLLDPRDDLGHISRPCVL